VQKSDASSGRDLVVLSSAPTPRLTTNPYIVMLNQAIAEVPGVELRTMSWRTAVLQRFDAFHVHWPETLISGGPLHKRTVRQVLFVIVLIRMRLMRIPLVRTVHNLDLPQDTTRTERALLRLGERATALRIYVNDEPDVRRPGPIATIVHGHYRDWYAEYPKAETVPGRVSFFGAIRRYKGVPALVAAFGETSGLMPGLTLRVAGEPSSDELAATLTADAAGDDRIQLSFGFLSDAELVRAVTEAELVVLPYPHMHNSGGVLAALSLDRPVLVPDNEVNRLLADEVGPGWVLRFSGALSARHIVDALDQLRVAGTRRPPDLSRRDWQTAGTDHVAAFRAALSATRSAKMSAKN
jgi:beta-1,4-mannosyltransferase